MYFKEFYDLLNFYNLLLRFNLETGDKKTAFSATEHVFWHLYVITTQVDRHYRGANKRQLPNRLYAII